MRPIPPEVGAAFERRMDEARVSRPERSDYRKWVRFYFHFCDKYGHPAAAAGSRGPFLAKLASKNQSVAQRNQASAAVGLLLQSAPEVLATGVSPPAASSSDPRPPLVSQAAVPSGGRDKGLRTGAQVSAIRPQPPDSGAWNRGGEGFPVGDGGALPCGCPLFAVGFCCF